MAHRRTRPLVRGSSRRSTSWLDIEPVFNAFSSGLAAITHVMTAAELARRPFTVVRSFIHAHIVTDQTAADEEQFGAIGICIVSSQAAAIGVTAVPTPVIDAASDLWLMHHWISASMTQASSIGFDAASGQAYELASKAMRKCNDDQEIIIVAESSAVISEGFLLSEAGRILIKDH